MKSDKSSTRRLRAFLILLISLVALFSTTAISYARFQKDSSLVSPSVGDISGKFSAVGNLPAEVAIQQKEPAGPSRIIIPDIGVNTNIESLGLTKDNAVDTPKSLWTTAWFNRSSKPGSPGPAMIVGHYSAYGRAVFANLGKLQNGQKIIITDEKSQQFTFAVSSNKTYPQAQVPMAALLGDKTSKPRLEVITCGGAYIKGQRDFTDRTVVTAYIVEG